MDVQPDPLIGRVLVGRYRIAEMLGQGGMGAVYSASQQPLGRSVVVKVMHPEYARDNTFRERFIREAKAVCALSHPNIVSVYDFGSTDDGLLFIAMEKLTGKTLADLLRSEGALPEERVLRILASVARALAEVHALGIVHRDLKPENVFVTTSSTGDDNVKVLDFGLAKLMPTRTASRAEQSLIVGTPGYMSPEQMQGKEIGPRSDVYSAGLIWWEMLVGRGPYHHVADTHERMLRQIVDGIPSPTSVNTSLKLAPGHEAALMSTLTKDPSTRPAHAAELLQLIRGFAHSLWLDVSSSEGAPSTSKPQPSPLVPTPRPTEAVAAPTTPNPKPKAPTPVAAETAADKARPLTKATVVDRGRKSDAEPKRPLALYAAGAVVVVIALATGAWGVANLSSKGAGSAETATTPTSSPTSLTSTVPSSTALTSTVGSATTPSATTLSATPSATTPSATTPSATTPSATTPSATTPSATVSPPPSTAGAAHDAEPRSHSDRAPLEAGTDAQGVKPSTRSTKTASTKATKPDAAKPDAAKPDAAKPDDALRSGVINPFAAKTP